MFFYIMIFETANLQLSPLKCNFLLIEIYNILIAKHLQTTKLRHLAAGEADLGHIAWEISISPREHQHAAPRPQPPPPLRTHAAKIRIFFRTTPPLWITFPIIFAGL